MVLLFHSYAFSYSQLLLPKSKTLFLIVVVNDNCKCILIIEWCEKDWLVGSLYYLGTSQKKNRKNAKMIYLKNKLGSSISIDHISKNIVKQGLRIESYYQWDIPSLWSKFQNLEPPRWKVIVKNSKMAYFPHKSHFRLPALKFMESLIYFRGNWRKWNMNLIGKPYN